MVRSRKLRKYLFYLLTSRYESVMEDYLPAPVAENMEDQAHVP
jgi:hypothetical protein